MLTPPEYSVLKWRYLDSLDSVRYSKTYLVIREADKPARVSHASIEVSATILMGNGLIVPVNQLIDSFGFLRIASEIIKVATAYEGKGKHVFLPFKYAISRYFLRVSLSTARIAWK